MTDYAVVEQSTLARSPLTAARRMGEMRHNVVHEGNFSNSAEFSTALIAGVRALVETADDRPKLLVISAHGVPVTGTNLQASDDEEINLWEFADHFAALPTSIVVFLSACFGGYPSARAIQKRSRRFVLGPLVDILPGHANAFQENLLNELASDFSCRSLLRIVRRHNNSLAKSYLHRSVFGLYDQAGNFFPRCAVGQLAATVSEPMIYRVISLATGPGGTHTGRCRLESDDRSIYDAGVAPLLRFVSHPIKLIGMRFRSRYQELEHRADGVKSICLLNVKKR
jgi:hypothetical protein